MNLFFCVVEISIAFVTVRAGCSVSFPELQHH